MKIFRILIIIGWILVCLSGQLFAQEEKITNERIYRELKVFQAQTEERLKAIELRFEQLNYFLTLMTSVFTAFVIAVIGFAYWDRRTIIRKAREDTIEYIERNNIPTRLYDILRDLAKEEPKVAKVLKQFHLL